MQYRTPRGIGAQVSRLCLGSMTFGAQADEAESIRMVRRALDAGINVVHAAAVYSTGVSETTVGKALAGKGAGVVLVSNELRESPWQGAAPEE